MNKLKSFYKSNRIYVILMGIGIFCICLILGALALYFMNQLKSNEYGNRLSGIENILISDKTKNSIQETIKENTKVSKVGVRIQGKIIYIDAEVTDGTVEEMQNLAVKSLDNLSDDEKDYYDISYIFIKKYDTEDTTFPLMGYKKAGEIIISWAKSSMD